MNKVKCSEDTPLWSTFRTMTVQFKVSDLFCPSGPASVTNLTVSSVNTTSLSFSWRPSDGHVDVYDLSLYSVSEAPAGPRAQVGRWSLLDGRSR